ncbi:hypothetical protein HYDPIDRAFT_25692 [Hydnomerulius pinastri MD-312]|nr:hypothetical protein HYDPIDRAFT_25692 [Hydnomerulius pinastri MD-312]
MPGGSRRHGKQKAQAADPDEDFLDEEAPPKEVGDNATTTSVSQPADGSRSASPEEGIRNLRYIRPQTVRKGNFEVDAPFYNTEHGVRSSASNAVPSQRHTKEPIEEGLKAELVGATFLSDDLADHMFGSLISTELASKILKGLLTKGMVKVEKEVAGKVTEVAIGSKDAKAAVNQARERALAHGCKRPGVTQLPTPAKQRDTPSWKWTWIDYPKQVREKDLVDYLNEVVDTALGLACLKNQKRRYRFAVPPDTTHAFPLAYPPDKADMRPDFVVIPIKAYPESQTPGGSEEYTPDREWLNFTTLRLTGECKASDTKKAVAQVQRYMRGTKRVQPWQRFVTGLSVTQHTVAFLRAEGSGLEVLVMELEHGRSSLEFVRVLLGIVLSDETVFGLSRHFELSTSKQKLLVPDAPLASSMLYTPPTSDALYFTSSVPAMSQHDTSAAALGSCEVSGLPSSHPASQATGSSRKRARGNDHEAGNEAGTSAAAKPPPRKKTAVGEGIKEASYVVQQPKTVFKCECLGTLFTSTSLRGRNTTTLGAIITVENGPKVYAALKMSWQDTDREKDRDAVRDRLLKFRQQRDGEMEMSDVVKNILEKGWDKNVLFPSSAPVKVEFDSTLRTIRAFTEDEADQGDVEDRVLEVSWTPLKRPVQYFWSIQDFVKGLIGALRGHQFLAYMGILHRDVSESNMVLALYPDDPRGYIMDLDMAVIYGEAQHPSVDLGIPEDILSKLWAEPPSSSSSGGRYRAARTGTAPYMSISVLSGASTHSHFDDIESFFYVLLLFFLSYNKPLPTNQLSAAHQRHFALEPTAARLPHITSWPPDIQTWGQLATQAPSSKFALMVKRVAQPQLWSLKATISEQWGQNLTPMIMKLIESTLNLFHEAALYRVHHEQFIGVLERWLEEYPTPVEGQNSCPFKDECGQQAV